MARAEKKILRNTPLDLAARYLCISEPAEKTLVLRATLGRIKPSFFLSFISSFLVFFN